MFEDIGQCKWRYAIVDGIKTDIVDAEMGVHGICPLCKSEITPRKGQIRFAHVVSPHGREYEYFCVTTTVSQGADPLNQKPLCALCDSAPLR